jgi:hypothetical protein
MEKAARNSDDRPSMQPAGAQAHKWPKRVLSPLQRLLRTGDTRDTVDRLFVSRHVNDLRLIAATGFLVSVLVLAASLVLAVFFCIDASTHTPPSGLVAWVTLLATNGGEPLIKAFGPTFVVLGAVLAWAYQVGSARLGVVDLFACEIDTLCRTIAVVDLPETLRRRFERGSDHPPATDETGGKSQAFSSEENYFPILESNARDLQSLEADVVTNITAFYNSMKAVRDMFRRVFLAQGDQLHAEAVNLMYMLYLSLEAGRMAMSDLVEFEPTHIERTLVILVSELPVYEFLRQHYPEPGEAHHERLVLRGPAYVGIMRDLESVLEVKKRHLQPVIKWNEAKTLNYEETQWRAAIRLLPSVRKEFLALKSSFSLEISATDA